MTFRSSAFLGLLLATLLSVGVRAAPAPTQLTVASWNVENLFDPLDDPDNEGDDEFLPTSWRRWSEARYGLKLEHLAWVIAQLKPDVLCLQEVENRHVLEELNKALLSRYGFEFPVIVHREGEDFRGIDVAVMARVPVVSTNWVTPVSGQRDVLTVTVAPGGAPLTIVCNHWKSWYGNREESIAIRAIQARALRGAIDGHLAETPAMALMVAGDFNVNIDSDTLTSTARFSTDREHVLKGPDGGLLYNLSAGLPANTRGSLYYRRDAVWNSFDSISVSAGMLGREGLETPWRVDEASYRVFQPEAIRDEFGHPLPFRSMRRKGGGSIYLEGYSDHFPVVVSVTRRK